MIRIKSRVAASFIIHRPADVELKIPAGIISLPAMTKRSVADASRRVRIKEYKAPIRIPFQIRGATISRKVLDLVAPTDSAASSMDLRCPIGVKIAERKGIVNKNAPAGIDKISESSRRFLSLTRSPPGKYI